jgi:hypothetical protein
METGLLAVFGDIFLRFLDQIGPHIVIHPNGFTLGIGIENPAGGFNLGQALFVSGAHLFALRTGFPAFFTVFGNLIPPLLGN